MKMDRLGIKSGIEVRSRLSRQRKATQGNAIHYRFLSPRLSHNINDDVEMKSLERVEGQDVNLKDG